jgi:hypothetical protein
MLRVSGLSRGGELRCHSAACRQASRSTQGPDQPAGLGQGDELGRGHHPPARIRLQLDPGHQLGVSALEGDMDARVAAGNTGVPPLTGDPGSGGNAGSHRISAGFTSDALASDALGSAG